MTNPAAPSTGGGQPLHNPADIDALGADLRAAGFDADHIPQLLGADANNALARGHHFPALAVTGKIARSGNADAPLATLIRLFLLATDEQASMVARALPTLGLDRAVAAGVVEAAGDGQIRAALDIRPHADDDRSYLVVSDLDADTRPGPLRPDHVLGIGAASMTLARAVIRRPVETVLDLGTGCGIQALHIAGHADTIVATDTNPRALALAAATARLSGVEFDLRSGSLFEPVVGQQFDLIVSNPPFVISSGEQRFEYRDSGVAGDGLCRELVTQIADYLRPGGTAQLLANWMVTGDGDWRLRVGEWVAQTGCDGWVVQRDIAKPGEYVAMWLSDAGEMPPSDAETLTERWLDYFAREDVTGIGMGTIILRKPEQPIDDVPDVVFDELTAPGDELTGDEVDAFLARRAFLATRSEADLLATRFALAPTTMLHTRSLPSPQGWAPVLRMLSRPGGPGASVQLDQWGAALLGGCTGTVPLGTQLELLATAHELDDDALTAAMMPTIRTAITRGLIHPVADDQDATS